MAIYKPSQHTPNLQEVDLTKDNTFSCIVNTSGESIVAYKMQILSGRGDQVIYAPTTPTTLTKPVKNKGILKINDIKNTLVSGLTNGKDYQWGVRVYNQAPNATTQPNTLVCDGFLVGSTKYVIWCEISEANKTDYDQIVYDRYIEFDTTRANMIKGAKDDASLEIPDTLRERKKIEWVTKELGRNKNIVKIETKEDFTYNYIDKTPFKIYQCSDEHTLKSFFADPNSNINVAHYVVIFDTPENAKKAHDASYVPSLAEIGKGDDADDDTAQHTADGLIHKPQKIIGYSSDTGEVRLGQSYSTQPINGQAYMIFEYDPVGKVCNEIIPTIENDADQTIKDNPYLTQIIGGTAITSNLYKVMTNRWDDTVKRLFIQPNINIKSDETNPNELVFDNGIRVDIQKQVYTNDSGKEIDITFDKLDNTQWLLTAPSQVNGIPPIIPQTDYKIYTDFVDSMPFNLFYARNTPELKIQCRNNNTKEESIYKEIVSDSPYSYREIGFKTLISGAQQEIKYYYYVLYDEDNNIVDKSIDIYSNEIEWVYRGLESGTEYDEPKNYTIQVVLVDEYNNSFTKSVEFGVYYNIEKGLDSFPPIPDCHEKAFKINTITPIYVESTSYVENENIITTVTNNNIDDGVVSIPKNYTLNYTKVLNEDSAIVIPEQFSLLTEFQVTGDFVSNIPNGGESEIFSFTNKTSQGQFDTYSVKLSSSMKFYMTTEENPQIMVNDDILKIRIYKNKSTTPLFCFGTNDYYRVITDDNKDYQYPSMLGYVLQNAANYEIRNSLPTVGTQGTKYILTKNTSSYQAGVWKYDNNRGWVVDYSVQFVFVENLNQLPEEYRDGFLVPENCLESDGTTLRFEDASNVYIDNSENLEAINKKFFNQKWFTFYFVLDDKGTESCMIEINKK